uniref:Uncharacterized protein AlNc14C8G1105 n=1 Tax=Albugo laibachii Nc14 TaxID=890382 RepID=F0W232_9STRA|nr:conserved hypothetical protein [Albugo laibachii Nc14]|eukprot:CCA15111.1 conserved hypothetical protein [Albugo laibachii Nc14]
MEVSSSQILNRELEALSDTVNLCNPLTFYHTNDWKSSSQNALSIAKKEQGYIARLPDTFILTKQPEHLAIKNASSVAPNTLQHSLSAIRPNKVAQSMQRSHLNGILAGLPGSKSVPTSSYTREFVYSEQMGDMNENKNMEFFRKKDAHSEYVEARARFRKMHSVT